MKNKVLFVLNILIIIFCGVMLYLHFSGQYKLTTRAIIKASVLLVTYFFGVLSYFFKSQAPNTAHYADLYQHILKDAFSNDRTGYNRLMKCLMQYNNNQVDAALSGLIKLQKRCKKTQDTSAVLFLIAKCHEEKGAPKQAMEYYERLLKIDASNSSAWSNLGHLYDEAGRMNDAKYALNQALLSNPENAYAYCNLANVYYQNGEFEEAKNFGLKSFHLNNKLAPAASVTALAYACLGDAENARKFCKIYGTTQDNKRLVSLVEQQLRS